MLIIYFYVSVEFLILIATPLVCSLEIYIDHKNVVDVTDLDPRRPVRF